VCWKLPDFEDDQLAVMNNGVEGDIEDDDDE
jgi:hypothetical protein